MTDRSLSRRRLVVAGAAGLGAAGGAAAGWTLGHRPDETADSASGSGPEPDAASGSSPAPASHDVEGEVSVPFDGEHQAGIATPPQRHAVFAGLDLAAGVTRPDLVRLLRVLTEDARRLCAGEPPVGAVEPTLAREPASLTVTVGFGPGLLRAAGASAQSPPWLRPLPAFDVDRLEDRWSDADLLLQVCAEDAMTVRHAVRSLHRALRSFATPAWLQSGFTRPTNQSRGEARGARNLFGQVDGTVNPVPGSEDFAGLVWASDGPEWLRGGTGLVLRRIRMDLDGWEALGREEKEAVVGRRLADGMPPAGAVAPDGDVDLEARDANGLGVLAPWAHVRRARGEADGPPFLRRGYSYDDGLDDTGRTDAGLLFAAYCADVDAQFVPVQRRLAELDQLNEWTTPVGSTVVAVPPGPSRDGFIGETLLG